MAWRILLPLLGSGPAWAVAMASATEVAVPPQLDSATPPVSRLSCEQLHWRMSEALPEVCGVTPYATRTERKGKKRGRWAKCFEYLSSWDDANQMCLELGGRLCSAAETAADVTAQTGCWFNMKRVWTSDSCGAGMVMTQAGSSLHMKKIKPLCQAKTERKYARCCADTQLASPVPTETLEKLRGFMNVVSLAAHANKSTSEIELQGMAFGSWLLVDYDKPALFEQVQLSPKANPLPGVASTLLVAQEGPVLLNTPLQWAHEQGAKVAVRRSPLVFPTPTTTPTPKLNASEVLPIPLVPTPPEPYNKKPIEAMSGGDLCKKVVLGSGVWGWDCEQHYGWWPIPDVGKVKVEGGKAVKYPPQPPLQPSTPEDPPIVPVPVKPTKVQVPQPEGPPILSEPGHKCKKNTRLGVWVCDPWNLVTPLPHLKPLPTPRPESPVLGLKVSQEVVPPPLREISLSEGMDEQLNSMVKEMVAFSGEDAALNQHVLDTLTEMDEDQEANDEDTVVPLECPTDFECVHGKCNGGSCLCDQYWKGVVCNTSLPTPTPTPTPYIPLPAAFLKGTFPEVDREEPRPADDGLSPPNPPKPTPAIIEGFAPMDVVASPAP